MYPCEDKGLEKAAAGSGRGAGHCFVHNGLVLLRKAPSSTPVFVSSFFKIFYLTSVRGLLVFFP